MNWPPSWRAGDDVRNLIDRHERQTMRDHEGDWEPVPSWVEWSLIIVVVVACVVGLIWLRAR